MQEFDPPQFLRTFFLLESSYFKFLNDGFTVVPEINLDNKDSKEIIW